ncbi:hypothetical protein M422DRAFT_32484, partial [Sphaerobolus stellatus SS14]
MIKNNCIQNTLEIILSDQKPHKDLNVKPLYILELREVNSLINKSPSATISKNVGKRFDMQPSANGYTLTFSFNYKSVNNRLETTQHYSWSLITAELEHKLGLGPHLHKLYSLKVWTDHADDTVNSEYYEHWLSKNMWAHGNEVGILEFRSLKGHVLFAWDRLREVVGDLVLPYVTPI